MTDPRTDPPFIADEHRMLAAWLDWHRQTLEVKCQGLSQEQLRQRSVPPSDMSLLGLVRHMASVEWAWFRFFLEGSDRPDPIKGPDNLEGDFRDVDTASVEEAFALWHAEIAHAREVSAALSLEAIGTRKRHGEDCSHRWVLVHMIEEYARHNGHADLLRERIDGATGE
ncbi:MAG TPA: DinB family protein [Nocardiopsis listeri]|uniref:DinB family protein n=1 Tax=Nocardiopsis listeri TaxID=53440 RepID=UPI001DE9EDFE|nr:DinB family protein [Nocardiopsis listeri]HJE60452.1 DinB family protein [Nocardiopsis listeri]